MAVVDGGPVAAGLLDLVHRHVSGAEHVVGGQGLLPTEQRDADADVHRRPGRTLAQHGAQLERNRERLFLGDLGQDDGELIAADPRHDVGFSEPALEHLRHRAE